MKDGERLSGAVQENVLVLLCFDPAHARMVRAALTPQHFESPLFREVSGLAIDFLDQYGEPIGDHLPDHLEHVLKGDDARKAKSYQRLVDQLFRARDSVNAEYVVSVLHKWVRQQTMKDAILKATEHILDGRVDEAEVALQAGLRTGVGTFEPGIDLARPDEALAFLDRPEESLLMGVAALDRFGIGPAPRTLFLLNGPLGKGKSWGLMHIGKYALLQRKQVVHITLEMSAEKVAQRYIQSFFSVTRWQEARGTEVPRIVRARDGGIETIEFDRLNLPSLQDPGIRDLLRQRIERRLSRRAAFKVKKFASGSLTVPALNAYLDGLERHERIVPDVLIIDYAELMRLESGDKKRGSIGQLFVDLRGIADERNLALVTASQVNRGGIGKTTSDESDLAEDISKGFTVDTMVTYNQTRTEERVGLARLFVAKNRDGEGRMTALITQAYAMGQFCLDSVLMTDRYSPHGRLGESDDERDEEPERRPPPRRRR